MPTFVDESGKGAMARDGLSRSDDSGRLVLSWIKLLMAASIGVVACTTESAAPIPPSAEAGMLTAEALDGWNEATGKFVIAKPAPESYAQMPAERAQLFALAYVRNFGRKGASRWSKEAGFSFDHTTLRVCGTQYARGQYEITPELPPFLRNAASAQYLITFCTPASSPVLVVAVASAALGLVIDERGRLLFPQVGGHEITATGIPRSAGSIPPTAEQAVAAVARATGRRVSRVPALVAADIRTQPFFAVWKIDLESSINVLSGSGAGSVSEVFAGYYDRVLGIQSRRGSAWGRTTAADSVKFTDAVTGESKLVVLSRRIDVPARFESWSLAPEAQQ